MDGLVLIDKAAGMTSHDVVARFRRVSKQKRAGHTGTLDPAATGLLVICSGRATRLQSYLMGEAKTYEGEIEFGWATTTYDAEGDPLGATGPVDVSHVDFRSAVRPFLGDIDQMPPAYSAKKIDGRRAYDLAREGVAPKLEPKRVTVYEFEITRVEGSRASFHVRCSSGTYIRSLAHDLGVAIGIAAHLRSLRRTSIGELDVGSALSVERLLAATPAAIFSPPHFIPMGQVPLPMSRLLVDITQEAKIRHGQAVMVNALGSVVRQGDLVALENLNAELVGIGEAGPVVREGGPVAVRPKVVL